jgi:hypothetical protein
LWPRHEVAVFAQRGANTPATDFYPHQVIDAKDTKGFTNAVRDFQPEVIHTHYLHLAPFVSTLSKKAGVPYSIRSHSYDILGRTPKYLRSFRRLINDDRCLGILVLPFLRERLIDAGMHEDKLHECFPVVDVEHFFDRSENTVGVMNVGAALPKKALRSYIDLATRIDEVPVDLYATGYGIDELHEFNSELGHPVTIVPPVQFAEMPQVYKSHSWLIYTASKDIGTVGWPMAVAEAQAAGVGVCIDGIREDLRAYVGGAGYVLENLSDALDIIADPVPPDIREAGFDQCRRSDVRQHIATLENLWD